MANRIVGVVFWGAAPLGLVHKGCGFKLNFLPIPRSVRILYLVNINVVIYAVIIRDRSFSAPPLATPSVPSGKSPLRLTGRRLLVTGHLLFSGPKSRITVHVHCQRADIFCFALLHRLPGTGFSRITGHEPRVTFMLSLLQRSKLPKPLRNQHRVGGGLHLANCVARRTLRAADAAEESGI